MERESLLIMFSLLLIIVILCSMRIRDTHSNKTSLNVSKLIENENVDDMCLKIYYLYSSALMLYPVSTVEDLISRSDEKIIVKGSELEEHMDLLKQIKDDIFYDIVMPFLSDDAARELEK